MASVDQLHRSFGEYGRGRLAIRLLKQHVASKPLDPHELAQATGTAEFARDRGNPGHIAAVRPAILLGSISTFEGFVEEFMAEALALRGSTLAQIARELGGDRFNNPSVERWETVVRRYFNGVSTQQFGVEVDLYRTQANFARRTTLGWADAKAAASGWMSARHIITHGGATGLSAEVWPPPIRPGDVPATDVLKPEPNGRHSLRYGASIGAGRIYVHAARHLADQVAAQVGAQLAWTAMPDAFAGASPP
jgi:hypothetical protein